MFDSCSTIIRGTSITCRAAELKAPPPESPEAVLTATERRGLHPAAPGRVAVV